jgi:cell division septal protein FtsQ
MVGGGRPEPGKRRRARAASAVVPLPRPAAGDRLDLARLVPSGRSLLLAFGILGAAFAAFWGARASSVFAVERVEVRGAPASVQHEVERATRDVLGTSLLAVDTSAVEGAVTSLHSIAVASVDRAFPHTLVVRVAPVRIVGVAVRGDDAWVVSASNRAVRAIDPRAERGLPRFWLPRKLRVEVGRALPAAYEPVTRTLATLRDARIPARIKGVRATNGQIVVVLESGRELLLGPAVDIVVKLAVAARVLPLLGDEMRYLDVTVPERPVASLDLNSQVESETRG